MIDALSLEQQKAALEKLLDTLEATSVPTYELIPFSKISKRFLTTLVCMRTMTQKFH
jgi:hypothetical protein